MLFTMGFFSNKMSVLGNFAHHITLKPGETGGSGLLGVLGQSLGYLLIKQSSVTFSHFGSYEHGNMRHI